jgi:hypothetical protein
MNTVKNLNDDSIQIYSCSEREAVIAAHAQSRNDWSTWQYEERYGHLAAEDDDKWTCGAFYCIKN